MRTIALGGHGAALAVPMLAALAGAAEPADTRTTALLRDPSFRQGVVVYDPAPGRHVRRGVLRPDANTPPPAWGLAQWHSRFSPAGGAPQRLPGGAVRFADAAKSVTFAGGGLVLAIDSGKEYGGRPRRKGEPWPHLLVEQEIAACPPLTELSAVRFRIEYRLLRCVARQPERQDAALHAAQFQAFVTVQDRNRQSKGFGDYLWFGVPMYDSRHRSPKAYAAGDFAGSGKFICTPAASTFTRQSAHDGQWVRIDGDLLPLIREALRTAWQRGYLKRSREPGDFRLGSFNLGWEMPGAFDAAVEVRNLALEAEATRRAPASQPAK
ncbi:MAG TPA: hypothetical protein VM695_12380 [Phycisphaerae bacterium]|nr:hypothetical protein [Phycisphaerae bacterium]